MQKNERTVIYMLEFEVNGQRLRIKGNLYVVAESIDYLKARFSFSADWDGVIKTAIFKTADRKNVYHVILDENGICTVPSEVIHAPMFHVSVFGGSRITVNEVQVLCDVSGYAEGGAPEEPTPDVYEQILAEINKKVSKVDGMGLSENSYTTEEKTKLDGIAEGAEVNVQSDWGQDNESADDYIKNKPTKLSQFVNDSGYTTSDDLSSLSSGLSQGITNVSTALSNHQSAAVLPHADGSVTTDKLADGSVTAEKIADDVLFSGKYDDLSNVPEEFPPSEHSHTVADITDLPDWTKQPEKPTYTADEVGALAADGTAVRATADADGNNIPDTYATRVQVGGLSGDITDVKGEVDELKSDLTYLDSWLSESIENTIMEKIDCTVATNQVLSASGATMGQWVRDNFANVYYTRDCAKYKYLYFTAPTTENQTTYGFVFYDVNDSPLLGVVSSAGKNGTEKICYKVPDNAVTFATWYWADSTFVANLEPFALYGLYSYVEEIKGLKEKYRSIEKRVFPLERYDDGLLTTGIYNTLLVGKLLTEVECFEAVEFLIQVAVNYDETYHNYRSDSPWTDVATFRNDMKALVQNVYATNYWHFKVFVRWPNESSISVSDVKLLVDSGLVGKCGFSTISIAASNASEESKNIADLICDGLNDDITINTAVWLMRNGGTIKFSEGDYYINSFSYNYDNVRPTAILLENHSDKCITFTLEGYCNPMITANNVNTEASRFHVTDSCLDSLDENTLVSFIRSTRNNIKININNIYIETKDKTKPIVFLDGDRSENICINHVLINNGGFENKSLPNPLSIGVLGTRGSNPGYDYEWKNSFVFGCNEGYRVRGEHLILWCCGARMCNYGYTFSAIPQSGLYCHPITLINCCDELNANMPYFGIDANEISDLSKNSRQALTFIDFNLEWVADYSPVGNRNYAMEFQPNRFVGTIDYTIQAQYGYYENSKFTPFWADGHGHGFKSRNQAHCLAGDSAERRSYSNWGAANYMQTYFDTDLNKMLVFDGAAWRDFNGNVID